VQSVLERAIGAVEVGYLVSAMRQAREETDPSPASSSFVSRVKEFIRSIVDKSK
jgi:hypothetical protein